jgi:hypothetical protein
MTCKLINNTNVKTLLLHYGDHTLVQIELEHDVDNYHFRILNLYIPNTELFSPEVMMICFFVGLFENGNELF